MIPSILKIMETATKLIGIMIQWRRKYIIKQALGVIGYNYLPSNVFYYTASVNIVKINYESQSLPVLTELDNNKAHTKPRVTLFYSV